MTDGETHIINWKPITSASRLVTYSNLIKSIYLLTAAKKKKEKEIPLLKERKVRNKLTTYTIPTHFATQTNWLKSTLCPYSVRIHLLIRLLSQHAHRHTCVTAVLSKVTAGYILRIAYLKFLTICTRKQQEAVVERQRDSVWYEANVHRQEPSCRYRVSRPYSWCTLATGVHNCPSMMFRTCCCLRPKCKRSYLLI